MVAIVSLCPVPMGKGKAVAQEPVAVCRSSQCPHIVSHLHGHAIQPSEACSCLKKHSSICVKLPEDFQTALWLLHNQANSLIKNCTSPDIDTGSCD